MKTLFLKRLFILTLSALLPFLTFAQEATEIEMASTLRDSGKIYVVVGVLTIIFIGIIVFLIRIDSKVSKLEKEHNKL